MPVYYYNYVVVQALKELEAYINKLTIYPAKNIEEEYEIDIMIGKLCEAYNKLKKHEFEYLI